MRWVAALTLAAASVVGCGPEGVHRPLAIEIEGLSARAAVLVVDVFPGAHGQTCQGVTLETASGLGAPHSMRWERASMGERRIELPQIDDESVTIVAYAIDGADKTIQFACAEVAFAKIGELRLGVLPLTLSRRMD